jgi:hypothetical protein
MSYLKLVFNFIKYLIIENPIKLLMVIAAIVAFNYAGTIPGGYEYYDIVSQSKDGNTNIYVIRSHEQNSENPYDVYSSNKPEKIENNQLKFWDYHDGNILIWAVFGILSLLITIFTIIGLANDNDDIGWDIEDCYTLSISTLIYCELEGDTYYYMIMGRLIEMRKDQMRYSSNLAREMRIFNMSDVYRLPKFSTKTQKRNNNLDKLGIN